MTSQAHLLVPSPPLMTLFVSVILYFFYIHSLIIRSIHTAQCRYCFKFCFILPSTEREGGISMALETVPILAYPFQRLSNPA